MLQLPFDVQRHEILPHMTQYFLDKAQEIFQHGRYLRITRPNWLVWPQPPPPLTNWIIAVNSFKDALGRGRFVDIRFLELEDVTYMTMDMLHQMFLQASDDELDSISYLYPQSKKFIQTIARDVQSILEIARILKRIGGF